jgi:hypothetical protein
VNLHKLSEEEEKALEQRREDEMKELNKLVSRCLRK